MFRLGTSFTQYLCISNLYFRQSGIKMQHYLVFSIIQAKATRLTPDKYMWHLYVLFDSLTFQIYLYNERIKKPCYSQIAQKVLNRFASK